MKESFSSKLVRSRLNLAGRTERERLTKTAHALRVWGVEGEDEDCD